MQCCDIWSNSSPRYPVALPSYPSLYSHPPISLLSPPVRVIIPSETASSGNTAKRWKPWEGYWQPSGRKIEWKRREKEEKEAVNLRPQKATLTVSFLHYLLPGSCSCSPTFIPDINSPYLQLQAPGEQALVCCIQSGKSVMLGFFLP